MKIAILSFYSGVIERGAETFAEELARRLASSYEVTLFQSGQLKIKSKNLNVTQIKTSGKIESKTTGLLRKFYIDNQSLKILYFTLKSISHQRKVKFDVVIPLNGGWQTVIVRIFSKIIGSKMIVSGQAGIGADDAWNIFFRPDSFVALTKAQFKWAKRLAPEVKIFQIPNGVDLSKFNPQVIPLKLPLEKPIVVCIGALDKNKRVDLTIKAVAKTTNLNLLVLGDGAARGQIDSLGKRLLGKRYLRMVVPHQEIPKYLRACQVFTLLSKNEAFGTSYIEAMACNLPVVATADSSRMEIIGKAGILSDPENIERYAKDLTIAATTNYRNIPYDQSLKYSWNNIATKYEKLVHELISKK